MPKKRLKLAPVELMLMKAVWRRGEATVQQVRDDVRPQRALAYTTVLTMLRTLEGKGFLAHESRGRAYVYRPLISEERVSRGMLKDLVNQVFDGSRELLLSKLFEVGELDEDDMEALRRLTRRPGKKARTGASLREGEDA